MNSAIHNRIEAIAGAIALGEADDAQRREYREHLSSCARCLKELGGEHELERVAATVAAAREDEKWQPDLRNAVASRMQRRAYNLRYGFGIAGLCLAVSLGVHALVVAGITPFTTGTQKTVAADTGATRIVLEQRVPVNQQGVRAAQAAPQRQLVVMHNIVSMQRAAVTSAQNPANARRVQPREIASITVHPKPQYGAKARTATGAALSGEHNASWQTVATTTTTALTETAPQTLTHSAESLQFAPVRASREVMPIGGETAINPQPPMIAYDEGAQGTSVFEVLVDDRGTPTKCVITKSSGYAVLDSTVCKAAMSTHFSPKIQDGRPVSGVYHDAFTFRVQDNPAIEGIPHQNP